MTFRKVSSTGHEAWDKELNTIWTCMIAYNMTQPYV